MRQLLQFTLDLFDTEPAPPRSSLGPTRTPDFEKNKPLPGVDRSSVAIEKIVDDGLPEAAVDRALAPERFAHPRANRAIALAGTLVSYEFRRGKRRTIGFSIGPDGLSVRAPTWVPLHEVDAALLDKAPWIVRKLGESRERQGRAHAARIDWRDGAEFPFFGEPVRLVLDPGHGFKAAGAQLHTGDAGRVLLVALPHGATAPQIRDAVQAWLMRQAHRCFVERLDHFAPRLGVRWKRLSLSNAGTRWGSASADGSIRLNWRLVHFRLPVIDYVVAHELSHLRVMDHSPRFWDTVESVMPDYGALRGELRQQPVPNW
jgi:predicted metal-dependent hydrolase